MMKLMGKALNKVPDMLHMSADVDERACCAVLTHDCCCCGCLSCLILCGLAGDARPYSKVPTRVDSGVNGRDGCDRTRYYDNTPTHPTYRDSRPAGKRESEVLLDMIQKNADNASALHYAAPHQPNISSQRPPQSGSV